MNAHNITVIGLLIALKLAFKALIYFPFLVTGYLCAGVILHRKDHGLLWLGMTLLFTFMVSLIFSILKNLIRHWRTRNVFFWIPLFIVCVAYTCVFPVYLVFDLIEKIVSKMTHQSNVALLTWIVSLAFGFFVFSRHRFFEDS